MNADLNVFKSCFTSSASAELEQRVFCPPISVNDSVHTRIATKRASHIPLTLAMLYISLLIIPCIIYYVTNKETLNLYVKHNKQS